MTKQDLYNLIDTEIAQFIEENPYSIKEKDLHANRSFFKVLLNNVKNRLNEEKIITRPYTFRTEQVICWLIDKIIEMCNVYEVVPSITLISVVLGIRVQTFTQIIRNNDIASIERLEQEYNGDYVLFFDNVENMDKVIYFNNIIDVYPMYSMLNTIKEMEQDARIERGKLGDITQLNAPTEVGGFGYAKPTMLVDSRKIMITGEAETLKMFLPNEERKEKNDNN